MGWDMSAVKAPASSVKTPYDLIPDEVKIAVEEAYEYCAANTTQRLIVAFLSDDERDQARTDVRSYCEARKEGKLTASLWSGYAGGETVDGIEVTRWSASASEVCTVPALSMVISKYQTKDEKKAAIAAARNAGTADGGE